MALRTVECRKYFVVIKEGSVIARMWLVQLVGHCLPTVEARDELQQVCLSGNVVVWCC